MEQLHFTPNAPYLQSIVSDLNCWHGQPRKNAKNCLKLCMKKAFQGVLALLMEQQSPLVKNLLKMEITILIVKKGESQNLQNIDTGIAS